MVSNRPEMMLITDRWRVAVGAGVGVEVGETPSSDSSLIVGKLFSHINYAYRMRDCLFSFFLTLSFTTTTTDLTCSRRSNYQKQICIM